MKQIKNKTILHSSLTLEDALGKKIPKEQTLLSLQTDSDTYQKFLGFLPPVVQ